MSRELINDLLMKLSLMGKLHAAHASVHKPSEPVPAATSTIRYSSSSAPTLSPLNAPLAGASPKALAEFADKMANWQTNVDANSSMVLQDDLRETVFNQAYQDVGPARLLSEAWDRYKTNILKTNENVASAADKSAALVKLNQIRKYSDRANEFKTLLDALTSSTSVMQRFPDALEYVRSNIYTAYRENEVRYRKDVIDAAITTVTNYIIPDPDPRQTTWDTFLTSSDNHSGVDPKLGSRMGLKYLYSMASAKLAKYLRDAAAGITKVRKDLGSTRDKVPLATELQRVVTSLNALVGRILDMQKGTSFEANSKDLVHILDSIINTYGDALSDTRSNRVLSKWAPGKGASGFVMSSDDMSNNWSSGKATDGATSQVAAPRLGYRLSTTQDGRRPGYVSEGVMYRVPDLNRMDGYISATKSFNATVGGDQAFLTSLDHLGTMALTSLREVNAASEKLSQATNGEIIVEVKRRAWSEHKMIILRSYARGVRNLVGRFVRVHAEFAVHHNRAALRYMEYWRSIGAAREIDSIKVYYDALEVIVRSSTDKLNDAAGIVRGIFDDRDVAVGLMQEHATNIQDFSTNLSAYISNASTSVRRMMTGNGPSILDLLTDPQAITVYALKVVRGITALLAASIASHAFRAIYAQKVYEQQTDPPSPFLFLLIMVGVELGITLVIAAIVYAIARITASSPDSPINTDLVGVWLADVAMTTAVIYAIAAVLAAVIQRKKYFRYYQEGDRGVRALTSLVLWTYMIVLLLPMFRLAG